MERLKLFGLIGIVVMWLWEGINLIVPIPFLDRDTIRTKSALSIIGISNRQRFRAKTIPDDFISTVDRAFQLTG